MMTAMKMMTTTNHKSTNLGRATEITRRILRAHEIGECKYLVELEVLHLQADHSGGSRYPVDGDYDGGAYGGQGRVWIEFKGF